MVSRNPFLRIDLSALERLRPYQVLSIEQIDVS